MKRTNAATIAVSTLLAAAGAGCGAAGDPSQDIGATDEELADEGLQYVATNNTCTVTMPDGSLSTTMMCCPAGKAMVGYAPAGRTGSFWSGYHYWLEGAKCKWFAHGTGPIFLDTSTTRSFPSFLGGVAPTTMHACPWGSVMVGIHAGLNRFACQRDSSPVLDEVADNTTKDNETYSISDPFMQTCGNAGSTKKMSGYTGSPRTIGCANDVPYPIIP